MSTKQRLSVEVLCDKCEEVYKQKDGIPSKRNARKLAKEAGWKTGKSKDFCPTCKDEIAEVVKQVQAGNLPAG